MQSCRSFGDVSLDAAKDIGKEAAAAGRAIAERYNRSDSSDNDYHEYDIGSEPCAGKENCDAKAVFALVEQFTPPQSLCIRQYSDCSGPGDHVLEGLGVYLTPPFNLPGPPLYAGDTNPIFTWSDQTALVSGNTTKDGHMFHFGQVIHAVYEFKGKVYIYTLGTGTGGSKKLNEAVGPSLIRPTHKQTADALK